MLNNIVDNIEQCGQHNIVQGCFHQPRTGCAFFRVYVALGIFRILHLRSLKWTIDTSKFSNIGWIKFVTHLVIYKEN